MQSSLQGKSTVFNAAVIVAALGYFVDIYDLILFSIVRVESLKDLGITAAQQITDQGLFLINMQMGGMLLGGILWGVLGDKRAGCRCCSAPSCSIRWPTWPMAS